MFAYILYAALGGAIGASLRYVSTTYVASVWGNVFPYGTMVVNVIGSFAMGVFFVLFAQKLNLSSDSWKVFLMTGVLGGFTTFSAFSLDAWQMIEKQAYLGAFSYVALSFTLSLGALILAIYITRSVS